ncbi:MAG: energy transducer TonB [Acidobacteria bacterium]|nr:MAG: energy transducer TonB [Acidobacteriota bacterium]REK01967.1 MAG: energy transducer TonB [Acidobacteriota bacterium]REK14923.1 MAG: energy transducer TonB [Acidobacteriota bacterium]REK45638.1 MAG: energy transducer TonB [Acidobacteriota bacterium]
MNFVRHFLIVGMALAVSATVVARSFDSCELALTFVDNETGEEIASPEVFLFTRKDRKTTKVKASEGKLLLQELKDGDTGVMTTSDGYMNSFFRFDLECRKSGETEPKDVIVPLWKGTDSKTIILEFAAGTEYLQLKDLGPKPKEGGEKGAPTLISRGVVNGTAIKLYRPEYPEAARSIRLRGLVEVEVTIGFDGLVENAEVIKGNKIFHDSVLSAVKRSKFAPTFLGGVPIKVRGVLVYDF